MPNVIVKILRDTDPCNPRTEWDNAGTMVCWHDRYQLGDKQPSCNPQEYLDDLPEGTLVLPLYLYDHSGITMSTGAFGCPWDSGQVGFIYATPEVIQNEWGGDRKRAQEYLENQVKVYDQFLTGDVWGFRVFEEQAKCECCDHQPEPEEVDSCWGFYGDCLEDIKAHLGPALYKAAEAAWEDRQ
jgi:hypothetical protein